MEYIVALSIGLIFYLAYLVQKKIDKLNNRISDLEKKLQ